MDAETVDKIAALAKQATDRVELTTALALPYDGASVNYLFKTNVTEYGIELGDRVAPLRPQALQVETLTGFIDAVRGGVAGDITKGRVVHVEDPFTVKVLDAEPDTFGVRNLRLVAKFKPTGQFEFETYTPGEKFIIALRTCFLFTEGDDSLWMLKLASNLKAGETVHAQDDGVNQTVTMKLNQVESVDVPVKPEIVLCPIRTFAEVAPAIERFLLRLKPAASQLPLIALFPLGGTKWKGDTMLAIKHYLAKHLPENSTILA